MSRSHYLLVALSLILLATCAVHAQPAQSGAQAGVTFSDRSSLSSLESVAKRMGVSAARSKAADPGVEYELKDETFELYVPPSYRGDEPWGLLVWVSPGPSGKTPANLCDILDKHKLLWVGANRSGNDRHAIVRFGLALDAAHNMKARYKVDERRVYVAGVSGGGRVSSMLGVSFAEAFQGGIYIIGSNTYSDLPAGDGKYWRRAFAPPPSPIMTLARKHSRHVFLEGEKDPNRDQSKSNFEYMKKSGFERLTYLEVPGLGHQTPPPEWIEKAIDALDQPLEPTGAKPATRPASQPTTIPGGSDQSHGRSSLRSPGFAAARCSAWHALRRTGFHGTHSTVSRRRTPSSGKATTFRSQNATSPHGWSACSTRLGRS